MTLGEKLSRLRRNNNYTQEQLASVLAVSRQTISKWESNLAYPETKQLIRLGELYGCSMDYLLKDEIENEDGIGIHYGRARIRERKSKRIVFGMPLWHVGKNANGFIAVGIKAKGVIAVGMAARGILSCGLVSLGIFSVGLLSVGLLSLGTISLGLLSAGAIAAGIITAGSICVGVLSFGAIAVGDFSVGAMAIGKYLAVGDRAQGMIAVGHTEAAGSLFEKIKELTPQDLEEIKRLLDDNVPFYLNWAKEIAMRCLR